MKINIVASGILISAFALMSTHCTSNALPKVQNPTYESYDLSGERGYHVNFEVDNDSIPATSVVINRIRQNISKDNKTGMKYHVNVIAQSRKIYGFKAKVTELENGIFFKTDSAEVFKPVKFQLIAK